MDTLGSDSGIVSESIDLLKGRSILGFSGCSLHPYKLNILSMANGVGYKNNNQ